MWSDFKFFVLPYCTRDFLCVASWQRGGDTVTQEVLNVQPQESGSARAPVFKTHIWGKTRILHLHDSMQYIMKSFCNLHPQYYVIPSHHRFLIKGHVQSANDTVTYLNLILVWIVSFRDLSEPRNNILWLGRLLKLSYQPLPIGVQSSDTSTWLVVQS